MKILIVDDSEISAYVTRRLLAQSGHEVEVSYEGKSAIEKAADFHPDYILMDINMPNMDGYETCKSIRNIPEMKDITIVALTGLDKDHIFVRAKESGFDDVVVKASGVEEIQKKIAVHKS